MRQLIILLALILLIGCNTYDKSNPFLSDGISEEIAYEGIPITVQSQPESESISETDSQPSELKIIKDGTISIKSKNLTESVKYIDSLLLDFDCYKSSESIEELNSRIEYNITIRVLFSQFDRLLSSIEEGEHNISDKTINTSDVTDQYYDLKSRLENNKEVEKRYIDLLKKANSVKDILEIERSLGQVRGDIESQQGRLNRLNNQIAYSTLHIRVYQQKSIKESGSDRDPFFRSIGISLKQGWNGLIDFIIVLIKIWPFWLIGIIIWRVIVYSRKRKNK